MPGTYEQNQPSGYSFKNSTVPSQPRIVPNSGSIQHSRPDQRSSAMTQSRPGQNSGFVPQSRPYQAQPQSRPFQPPPRPLQQGGVMGQPRAPQQSSTMTQSRPGQSMHQSGFMQPARQGQGQMNGRMSDRRLVTDIQTTFYPGLGLQFYYREKKPIFVRNQLKRKPFRTIWSWSRHAALLQK